MSGLGQDTVDTCRTLASIRYRPLTRPEHAHWMALHLKMAPVEVGLWIRRLHVQRLGVVCQRCLLPACQNTISYCTCDVEIALRLLMRHHMQGR